MATTMPPTQSSGALRPRVRKRNNNNNNASRNTNKSQKKSVVMCSVCEKIESRYKCPKCREGYCSVACCRTHKTQCSADKVLSVVAKATDTPTSTVPEPSKYRPLLGHAGRKRATLQRNPYEEEIDEEEEGWSITPKTKEAMKASEYIREELTDKGLQQLITDIVSAEGGWRGRSEALVEGKRLNPQFAVFLDKMLLATEIVHDEKLEDGASLGLTLAPVEKKKKVIVEERDEEVNLEKQIVSGEYSDADQDSSSSSDDSSCISTDESDR